MRAKIKGDKTEHLVNPMLIAPAVLMALVAVALIFMAIGRNKQMTERKVSFLEAPAADTHFYGESSTAPYQVVFDSENASSVKLKNITAAILNDMRLTYRLTDLAKDKADFQGCETLLLCTGALTRFGDRFEDFAKWSSLNNLIWLCMPEYSDQFTMIYRSLGISYCVGTYVEEVNGMHFTDDFIHGLEGVSCPQIDLSDVGLVVTLEDDSRVHITDTEHGLPLVWSYRRNNGTTAVVFNTNLMYARNNYTGFLTAALAETSDALIWPVINGMSAFIDDFPAPQPEGYDERLKEQFGYSTKSFLMNVWWPDMKELAKKYGLIYNGVLIEDYNARTEPPFTAGTADAIIKYYGAELLSEGGEIALHGYNHQPLIMEGTPTEDDYPGWPNTENMALATQELLRYAKRVFPDMTFSSYVPPSNNLSAEGIAVLRQTVPELKVISGVYYDPENGTAFMTDFEELDNGLIYYPRISSGFKAEEGDIVPIYSMLYSKGIFSHFIHPDDVLDVERGADLGWKVMLEEFDKMFEKMTTAYPGLRGLTASSGGGAVQRYQRLRYQITEDAQKTTITLEPFEDEVWLALDTRKEPTGVTGAELSGLGDGYYWLCCKDTVVEISWAGGAQ